MDILRLKHHATPHLSTSTWISLWHSWCLLSSPEHHAWNVGPRKSYKCSDWSAEFMGISREIYRISAQKSTNTWKNRKEKEGSVPITAIHGNSISVYVGSLGGKILSSVVREIQIAGIVRKHRRQFSFTEGTNGGNRSGRMSSASNAPGEQWEGRAWSLSVAIRPWRPWQSSPPITLRKSATMCHVRNRNFFMSFRPWSFSSHRNLAATADHSPNEVQTRRMKPPVARWSIYVWHWKLTVRRQVLLPIRINRLG